MSALLEDLGSYLIAGGIGTQDGVDVFRDFEPPEPANCVILAEYAGAPMNPVEPQIVLRSVQVTVRNTSTKNARLQAWEAYKLFATPTREFMIAGRSMNCYPRGTPIRRKIDKSGNHYWSFNMGVLTNLD